MMRRIMSLLVNPLVRLLLRSPLWRLLPGVMIVETVGRRSGRHRATPVQYVPDGPDIFALSRRGRLWWRNLQDGAPAHLRLRGRRRPAQAEILDPDAPLPAVFAGSVLAGPASRADAVIVRLHLTDTDTASASDARVATERRGN